MSLNSVPPYIDVVAHWVQAEAGGDAGALNALLDGDFRGDGPGGLVFTKQQWLDRYRSGDLVNSAFAWRPTGMSVHDHTAVVMGVQTQTATYRSHDCSGRFIGTLVLVRRTDSWSVVNLQLRPVDDESSRERTDAQND